MSQKAWMNAYTKGSKSLQARLAKIHANNPEFQDFVKKHGFGGNLSVKQSGMQKKSSVGTVKPVTEPSPEGNKNMDREAMIKAAAEKLRNRRMANANRVAFGGELGGGFALHNVGFRQYREDSEKSFKKGDKVFLRKDWAGEHAGLVFTVHHTNADGQHWIGRGKDKRGWYVNPDQIRHQSMKEEALTELSKDRLKWYVKHALRDMNHLDDASMGTQDPLWKKSVKRAQNISKAKRKMNEKWDESGYKDSEQSAEWKEKVRKDAAWRKPLPPKKTSFASGMKRAKAQLDADRAKRKVAEDIAYKDGTIAMYKGGWIAKRDGKKIGTTMPTDDHAKKLIDVTRKSLAHKTIDVIMRKKQEIARGLGRMSLAAESAQNRRRVRSWDSAVMPELKPLRVKPKTNPPFDPDPPKKNLGIVVGKNDPGYSKARHLARQGLKKQMERDRVNKTIDYISNPKYSVLDKNHINTLLKGK